MGSIEILQTDLQSERLFPSKKPPQRAVALSLLDATAAGFGQTSAIWLCQRPDNVHVDLADHFRRSLPLVLDAYPQWTGQVKSISTLDPSQLKSEELAFAPHARRVGRVYAHYGTPQDAGVEFVTARSSATLETLSPSSRTADQPILNCNNISFAELAPSTPLAHPLQQSASGQDGAVPPAMAIQLTELACGNFALSAKLSHALGDIQSLVTFAKDWSAISRWVLSGLGLTQPVLSPVFQPGLLDSKAAGDISGDQPDPEILDRAGALPLHRYDWWVSRAQCPWPQEIPAAFQDEELVPAGIAIPWSEWDVKSPVSHYLVHFTCDQVEILYQKAAEGGQINARISRHDVVLAHIWSCIARARNQQTDTGPLHCDLTCGTRPALDLGNNYIGSLSLMLNIEMSGIQLASPTQDNQLRNIALQIRETINKMNNPTALGVHLHSIAFEKTPQRICQGIPGQRHLLVSTWARAGLYDINFGLSDKPIIRYADAVIPDLDGHLVIKEAPPLNTSKRRESNWTENGVDISIRIRTEDMERLVRDPMLLP
ncbi:transferase family protein [Penicillium sp. IBT 35674x]|nr:transferase family protein [Penicillium sp. IBT 35674x]